MFVDFALLVNGKWLLDCQAEVYQAEQLLKETMEAKKAGDRWCWGFIDVTGSFGPPEAGSCRAIWRPTFNLQNCFGLVPIDYIIYIYI